MRGGLTRRPVQALADVLVDAVHALAPVQAGVAHALVELVLAAVARVARLACAAVSGDAVHTGSVVTGVRLAVIDVALTEGSLEPWPRSRDEMCILLGQSMLIQFYSVFLMCISAVFCAAFVGSFCICS